MAKKIQGADGNVYKQVDISNSSNSRKRTLEIVFGIISLILSIVSLASGFGLASFADAFGGGGSYTAELLFGIILSIVAFILVFFINKKHKIISSAIIIGSVKNLV